MKAKLPSALHRDVILFNARRWTAPELLAAGAIDAAEPSHQVLPKALQLAQSLRSKGRGPARKVLGALKRGLYREARDVHRLFCLVFAALRWFSRGFRPSEDQHRQVS